ncbi:MAG TPA: hypothetical protein VH307_31190 [Streptosporangiaceae bacterium]|jgi:hypothetical protein|nr:hypothetical protein [Streptosporangiaceae bacterium]
MTETELNTHIKVMIAQRQLFGYHVRNSIGSAAGWPDWVILGPGGILFRELKSESGMLSPEQGSIAVKLQAVGQNWDIWRPSDLRCGIIAREMDRIAIFKGEPNEP